MTKIPPTLVQDKDTAAESSDTEEIFCDHKLERKPLVDVDDGDKNRVNIRIQEQDHAIYYEIELKHNGEVLKTDLSAIEYPINIREKGRFANKRE